MRSFIPILRVCLCLLLCGLVVPATTRAYEVEGSRWPSNSPIVMYVQMVQATPTFIDGSHSWNEVAKSALSIWNPCIGSGVQFSVATTTTTNVRGEGRNSVFFSNGVFDQGFGADVLAVTVTETNDDGTQFTEADVIVNTACTFNAYRGPLVGNQGYDLRRVLVHEFGHVLGLDHVNQNVVAIMTPVISAIDTAMADDIAGVKSIYGPISGPLPVITSSLSALLVSGQNFQYQITASNTPISYYATGLLPGLSINTSTGVISGNATTYTGVYNVTLTATNAAGSTTSTLALTVPGPPVITSPGAIQAHVGQAFTYQITATFSPTSYTAFLGGNNPLPAGFTVDTATGLVSGIMPRDPPFFFVGARNAFGLGSRELYMDTNHGPPFVTGMTNYNVLSDGSHAYTGTPCSFYPYTDGYIVSLTATGLPDGLAVSPDGRSIQGTPTTAGTYTVTLTATGYEGVSTYVWTLLVTPGIALTSGGITGEIGTPLTYQVVGDPTPTSFQFASASDHPGLSIDPVTGIISGTPTANIVGSILVNLSNGTNAANVNIPAHITKYVLSSFFTGESLFYNGIYSLGFPSDTYGVYHVFGYYVYLETRGFILHYDLGYEYVIDANDGLRGAYFYDFASGGFFYSSPTFAFPYLYDFSLDSVVYYYPNPNDYSHYNTNGVRYFYVFNTGQIISK